MVKPHNLTLFYLPGRHPGHIHYLPEIDEHMNTTIYIRILYCYHCLITSVTVLNLILGPPYEVYHSFAHTYRKKRRQDLTPLRFSGTLLNSRNVISVGNGEYCLKQTVTK